MDPELFEGPDAFNNDRGPDLDPLLNDNMLVHYQPREFFTNFTFFKANCQ